MDRLSLKEKFSPRIKVALILACAVAVMTAAPFWGGKVLSWHDIAVGPSDSMDAQIFWQIRVPRVLVAFMAGAVFALSGMVFQAVFRNPLVCPFTLGVSAGASVGAAAYIALGMSFAVGRITGVSVFSFLGALVSIVLVRALARTRQGTSTAKMLLAGVAISFFFISLIMFIQYRSGVVQSMRISRWLMGGVFVFGYESVWDMLGLTVLGFVAIRYFTHHLNLLATGEDMAMSRGVDAARTVKILFLLISLLVGGVVAICGPIAFIGIMAPHICRLAIGSNHRYLTPAVLGAGGILLVLCDTLARTLAAPAEIPVGVMTALLGGPFFLWLLSTRFSEQTIAT